MHPYLYLFFLVLLTACAPEPQLTELPISEAERPLSATEQAVRDSLDLIWYDYETLRLPQAFGRARRLGAFVEDREELRGELRAEAWQVLAVLHFDHMVHEDSVGYYARLAGPQVGEDSPVEVRARQLLCESYATFDTWAWLEMGLHAQLGRRLLEGAGQDSTLLYAQLLLIEARGAKQVADREPTEARKEDFWRWSGTLFKDCIRLLNGMRSPWKGHAQEHYVILLARQEKHDEQIAQLLASISDTHYPSSIDFSLWPRFAWHDRRNRIDSTVRYARLELANGQDFLSKRDQEARYFLENYHIDKGDYPAAIQYLTESMVIRGCCPNGINPVDESAALTCSNRQTCIYFIAALARVYQDWYEQQRDPLVGKHAFRYVKAALASYESSLPLHVEEAMVNKTIVLGDRLVSIALRTTFDQLTHGQHSSAFDAYLEAVELSKSISLTRDLVSVVQASARDTVPSKTQRLRQLDAELKLLKASFAGQLELPSVSLNRYNRLYREYQKLDATTSWTSVDPVAPLRIGSSKVPSAEEIQRELSSKEAYLSYTETAETLYAVYIDADTIAAFSTPKDAVQPEVIAFTDALHTTSPLPTNRYTYAAKSLYARLLDPVQTAIHKRRQLLLSVSPSLSTVPFAALLRPDTDDFLIASHDLRYIDSWRGERANRKLRITPTAAVGSPAIGVWTHPDLSGYLAALGDGLVQQGSKLSSHYTGDNCTSQQLLDDMTRYDWLHLSVHARDNPNRLNQNYLHIGINDSINGVHVSRQILKAKLIVLAACSTARGYSNRREGTYSLRRSFHRAGVPDVVASLYNIPAAATASLLQVFYAELQAGRSVVGALGEAQRRCARGELGERWAWPGYWAGLVVG